MVCRRLEGKLSTAFPGETYEDMSQWLKLSAQLENSNVRWAPLIEVLKLLTDWFSF
jgi:hypothetical protein